MCGICGFIGNGDKEDLMRMTAAVVHRGPDEQGHWIDSDRGIYLGHRRLAIVDIPGGRQPMWTADGRIGVVYNGEIYNHLELRSELIRGGYVFLSDHSDTEVLLHGYRQWGTLLPEKLNGMWAFALWDRDKQLLFISRDRFGKKPLYYTFQNQTFAFASELTCLTRHRELTPTLSTANLKKFFAYGFIPSPGSLYKEIHRLPGGYNLIFDLRKQTFETQQYWQFRIEPFSHIPGNAQEQWGEEIRQLLQAAVKRRLMADVPLGVLLSGGLDSSAITAIASRLVDRDKLKTFTIGFEEPSFDEAGIAADVAQKYETDHHQQVISAEGIRRHLPGIAERLDEPFGDSSILPTYALCQMARERVTVALNGDGADELFAGYDPFRALRLAKLYAAVIPRPIHPAVRLAAALLPVTHGYMSAGFRIQRFLRGLSHPPWLWHPVWLGPLGPAELEQLFAEPTDVESVYSEAIACWEGSASKNPVDRSLEFYTRLYLQDNILVKADRAGMMNSLEVRSPYLDIDLVDFVRRIPSKWKLRGERTKYILKKAMEPLLPGQILKRRKQGFAAPIGKWFMESKLQWQGENLPPVLSPRFIDRKRLEHRQAKHDHRLFLYNTWLLQQYLGGVKP